MWNSITHQEDRESSNISTDRGAAVYPDDLILLWKTNGLSFTVFFTPVGK